MSSLDTAQNSVKEENTVTEKAAANSNNDDDTQVQVRDWRFWMVFAALSITGLLGAIEATIITTALPTIVRHLNVGNNYGWIANSFFLTS